MFFYILKYGTYKGLAIYSLFFSIAIIGWTIFQNWIGYLLTLPISLSMIWVSEFRQDSGFLELANTCLLFCQFIPGLVYLISRYILLEACLYIYF